MTDQSYIICMTPRSGSTLLIDLMRQTGVAGVPEAYFRSLSIDWFAEHLGVAPQDGWAYDRRYIDAAVAHARSTGPIAGFRMNWEAMPTLQQRLTLHFPDCATDIDRITAALGPTRFILLERTDKVAQAVSRLRAEQSGLWHRNADGTVREREEPGDQQGYDAAALRGYMAEARQNLTNWTTWLDQAGVTPHRVSYEDLAHDPQGTVKDVLTFLGLPADAADTIKPATARLADATSRAWTDRFKADHHD